jgi:hypothetical protein
MGKHENAVREAAKKAKLSQTVKETLALQTAAEKAADKEDLRRGIRSELVFSINQEKMRIAKLLDNVDWSKATLEKFQQPKKHWWNRPRSKEYATYFLGTLDPEWGNHKNGRRAFMRSDGWLYFEYHYEIMRDSWSGEDWWFEKKVILTSPEEWPRGNKELAKYLDLLRKFTV